MSIEEIRTYSLSFPGVEEDTPWEGHLAYKVGGKLFLITSTLNPTFSLKASDDDFISLMEHEGIIPAPYLARHKWVQLDSPTRLSSNELKRCLRSSYDLIRAKLPKRIQLSLE
jgi:predicted DNA-binding protein (MmcQ/YjbR family)